jgi:membrane protein DedA with SNARE-associated domain
LAAPERPQPTRRTLALIVTPILVLWVLGFVGAALTPTLLAKNPLLLVLLDPRNRNLILVSQKVDEVPFMLVGFLRRVLTDPLFYLLGYLYGERAVRWAEHRLGEAGTFVRGVEKAFAKAGPLVVFLAPGNLVCVLAGATRMRPLVFASMNVLGTVGILLVLYVFGDVFSGPVGAVNRFITRNFRWLTILSIVATAWWIWDQKRRGTFELESVDDIAEQLEEDAPERDKAEGAG